MCLCVLVASTRCQYHGGEVGPPVDKFEQVSSDDHQMSVVGGIGYSDPMGGGRYSGHMSRGRQYPTTITM